MARDDRATRPWQADTLLVHGGEQPRGDRSLLPPVYLTTAFDHGSAEQMEATFLHQAEGHVYSRLGNPTVEALERRVTALCNARGTVALGSGMSAVALALMALLKTGDQVLVGRHLFGGTYVLFAQTLAALGIEAVWVDPEDAAAAERACSPRVKAVFLEAIANPAMTVPDFTGYRRLCDRAGVPLIVDGTLLTPLHCGPGAVFPTGAPDVWVLSSSKFLAGAASTLGGLIVDTGRFAWAESAVVDLGDYRRLGAMAYLERIRRELMASIGPALSPLQAFLQLVGMETLALRLERQCRTTQTLAEWLARQPAVTQVLYPGLPAHPSHARCTAHLGGFFGSVLSFTLADKPACFRALNRLRLIRRAANLGDTRTLALHPASTIYSGLWPAQRESLGVPETMIRLSAGLEDVGDLIADLEGALG